MSGKWIGDRKNRGLGDVDETGFVDINGLPNALFTKGIQ